MTSASDGTLEERRVFCQNWRADVVAVTKSDGTPLEYVRYSAYGEPAVYPVADLNMDGVVNSTDSALWSDLLYSTSNASVYADSDLNFDGLDDWNSGGADGDLFYESYNANLGLSGVGRVSSAGVANRVGYAGYQWDQTISACHVRYRVYLPDIGRWTRRDPLGYVDGMGLYEYASSGAFASMDPDGLVCIAPGPPQSEDDSLRRYRADNEEWLEAGAWLIWNNYCDALVTRIKNIRRQIQDRQTKWRKNDGPWAPEGRTPLPERAPGDIANPRLSREGHRIVIENLRRRLRQMIQNYLDNDCGGRNTPDRAPRKRIVPLPKADPIQLPPEWLPGTAPADEFPGYEPQPQPVPPSRWRTPILRPPMPPAEPPFLQPLVPETIPIILPGRIPGVPATPVAPRLPVIPRVPRAA